MVEYEEDYEEYGDYEQPDGMGKVSHTDILFVFYLERLSFELFTFWYCDIFLLCLF